MTHQTDDLEKENALLKSEVAALHEHMGKVNKEAIEQYQGSQPYFNEMIRLTALTTSTAKLTLEDVETDEEVVVTDGPGEVADNPMNPLVQTDNSPASP
nr:hypothetical protein CFP56_39371 [Quercus suber]